MTYELDFIASTSTIYFYEEYQRKDTIGIVKKFNGHMLKINGVGWEQRFESALELRQRMRQRQRHTEGERVMERKGESERKRERKWKKERESESERKREKVKVK